MYCAGGARRDDGGSAAMTERAVVMVGGGPTGLMLAGELALAGIDVAIVLRRARHEFGRLALWQSHIERILANWVDELRVPIYSGREVTRMARDDTGSTSRSPTASRCGRTISSGATVDAV